MQDDLPLDEPPIEPEEDADDIVTPLSHLPKDELDELDPPEEDEDDDVVDLDEEEGDAF